LKVVSFQKKSNFSTKKKSIGITHSLLFMMKTKNYHLLKT